MQFGVDFTKFVVVASFGMLGHQKTIEVIQGPPARVSEAEVLFQALGGLSWEERADLLHLDMMQELGEDNDSTTIVPFLLPDDNKHYRFENAPAALDDELCPGCGIPLATGTNPTCTHHKGCGAKRQMRLEP